MSTCPIGLDTTMGRHCDDHLTTMHTCGWIRHTQSSHAQTAAGRLCGIAHRPALRRMCMPSTPQKSLDSAKNHTEKPGHCKEELAAGGLPAVLADRHHHHHHRQTCRQVSIPTDNHTRLSTRCVAAAGLTYPLWNAACIQSTPAHVHSKQVHA